MKLQNQLLLVALLGIVLPACFLVKDKKTPQRAQGLMPPSSGIGLTKIADSLRKSGPKLFNEVVTASFKTDSGFFNVHRSDDKFYLEIPDTLLDRDVLIVNRIAKAAVDNRVKRGADGFAGRQISRERVIRFTKGLKGKIFLQIISYAERSADSSANGMYASLQRSALQPLAATFDIKAAGLNKNTSVIDISEFISSGQPLLGFDASTKSTYGLNAFQKDKSYVIGFEAFTNNLELQTLNTYTKGENTVTYQLNSSLVLLPKEPMRARLADNRVGYFEEPYTDFDEPQGIKSLSVISRFRLEPKAEDVARYLRGELVEPKKPIVYYIDPATPKKWVKFLIAGVNDWQKAFEKAGFKNAIYAVEAPVNDKNWSLYDARHNAIMYMPSTLANAEGPHVHDPRSGEILEAHISWFHNVMSLLHGWYMVQVGPNDPRARKMVFDDELMGQLIRFVSSHEVGHTLGLTHNFKASSTVPVDSLRSLTYLKKNGFCPSIMDYARFNYVAQPQDGIPPDQLMPRIGVYDEWAIEWGYRWFPDQKSSEHERAFMDRWITEKITQDKRLSFGLSLGIPSDPRTQVEDLGDDAMKAGTYGINNLKIVMRNLPEWTKTPNGDFKNLSNMYKQVMSQFSRYTQHVVYNLTLYTNTQKSESQTGPVFGYISKAKKQAALAFLNKELFVYPQWVQNKKFQGYLGDGASHRVTAMQDKILTELISPLTFKSLKTSNFLAPATERFTFEDMLDGLKKYIMAELESGKFISTDRRVLQRLYIEKLIEIQHVGLKDPIHRQDIVYICKAHLTDLITGINKSLPKFKDRDSKLHLNELVSRLKWSMKPESFVPTVAPPAPIVFPFSATDHWRCNHQNL